jgi:phytoene dehydrogenase-like protein
MLDVLIIGAGLSGLSCALELQRHGISFQIVDASDAVGGRVRTDVVDGFRFDRGFQVMLTAYPELRRILDYKQLQLCDFEPGAMVWHNNDWHHVADPRRAPAKLGKTLVSPLGRLTDKLAVVKTALRLSGKPERKIFSEQEVTTETALRNAGFSEQMIDRFFRPFLGGIFLERDLKTSSRKFEFVFRMFSEGYASLPAKGMQAIPDQLASRLPANSIRLNARVNSIESGTARLITGEEIRARKFVIATDAAACARLVPQFDAPPALATECMYFSVPEPPHSQPVLMLNGDHDGPINNMSVISNIAPSYAPEGVALISISVIGTTYPDEARLERAVRAQLENWFGEQTKTWRFLQSYRVWNALPAQFAGASGLQIRPSRVSEGIYLAGDHLDSASLNGAVASGRRAAEAVAVDMGVRAATEKAS